MPKVLEAMIWPGPERLARQAQFVARGKNRNPRLADHRQFGMVHRRGQRDGAGIEQAASCKPGPAFGEINACWPYMAAGFRGLRDQHQPVLEPLGVFLDEYRVRALGHRGSSKNADGRAGGKGSVEPVTRRDSPCSLSLAPVTASLARTA
jgi:hypothetical protein